MTVVLRRSAVLNPRFNPDTDLIGVRVPDHRLVRLLCRLCAGPVALTSANVSNGRSSLCLAEFSALLPHLSLAFDDGGRLAQLAADERAGSTVVDLSRAGRFAVIREGSAAARTRKVLTGAGIVEDSES